MCSEITPTLKNLCVTLRSLRLCIEASQGLANHFPDGIYFVGLANLTEPETAVYEIARSVGVRESSGTRQGLVDSLKERLRDCTNPKRARYAVAPQTSPIPEQVS